MEGTSIVSIGSDVGSAYDKTRTTHITHVAMVHPGGRWFVCSNGVMYDANDQGVTWVRASQWRGRPSIDDLFVIGGDGFVDGSMVSTAVPTYP